MTHLFAYITSNNSIVPFQLHTNAAFIIVDSPMRKSPTDVISLVQNSNTASENGEDGLVTNNTYSAVYYPAGATTEPLNGNTVIVPPSHMALYTYAYNDNISFQWFAPAGTTRGVVQNASSVIDKSSWQLIIFTIKNYSEIFLTMAMAAIGLLTNFTELKKLGAKPLLVGLIAAVSAGFISATYIFLFVFNK